MQISRLALLVGVLSGACLLPAAKTPDGGFLQATTPRVWKFPQDHGRHDGFKTEWWYFTGNLKTADGRPFGFQLTIFRTSIAPAAPGRVSGWATSDIYFAHAHLSDIQNKKYLVADVASRAREGLAMASDHDLDVTLLDWSIRRETDGSIHLVSAGNSFSLDLVCTSEREPVLEGPGGLSKKGNALGQASYYYSLTRLATRGRIVLDGKSLAVSGLAWMDHEFSSNQLSTNQAGWDWMSLQMDDGSDLMVYRMRDHDGKTDFAFATRVLADGKISYLTGDDISLAGSHPWKSARTGGDYPQEWRVSLRGMAAFDLFTRYDDQEMHPEHSPRITYYEGAAEARSVDGRQIGTGYLEMTGYGASLGGSF